MLSGRQAVSDLPSGGVSDNAQRKASVLADKDRYLCQIAFVEIAFRHSSAELQFEDGVITLGGNDAENQQPPITGAETLTRPVLRKKVFHLIIPETGIHIFLHIFFQVYLNNNSI